MRLTPKDWALALAHATRLAPEKEAARLMKRLITLLTERGSANLLPRVLAALPKAIDEAAAANRVNVETGRELPKKTLDDVLAALGIDRETADVKVTVAPELIGGVRVRQKDRVTDLSIGGRIAKLRNIGRRKA